MAIAVLSSKNYSRNELRIINDRINRERQLRRRITVFVVSLFIFISLLILFSANKSMAADSSETVFYKYYTTIEVQPGDTLYTISLDYVVDGKQTSKQFIRDVVYMNSLESEGSLIAGTHIVIPYYDVYHN